MSGGAMLIQPEKVVLVDMVADTLRSIVRADNVFPTRLPAPLSYDPQQSQHQPWELELQPMQSSVQLVASNTGP